MKGFIKKGAVMVAMTMVLTGCGEGMIELTESEEAVIANYSAGTLAKHNRYQVEGLTMVYPEEEEPETEPEQENAAEEPTEDSSTADNTNNAPADVPNEPQASSVTLTDAFAIPGIAMEYVDYSISEEYVQGEYFYMEPAEGNCYLALNVNISNLNAEAVTCDILSRQPIFNLKLNGGTAIKNEVTMLTNDLSTFYEALEPGVSVSTILLFEISNETAANISSMELGLNVEGSIYQIQMQ